MRKTFEKGSQEQQAFSDFWNLMQDYWEPEDNEKYWDDYITESNGLFHRYGKNKLVRDVINCFTDYLEYKFKEEKKNAETQRIR